MGLSCCVMCMGSAGRVRMLEGLNCRRLDVERERRVGGRGEGVSVGEGGRRRDRVTALREGERGKARRYSLRSWILGKLVDSGSHVSKPLAPRPVATLGSREWGLRTG